MDLVARCHFHIVILNVKKMNEVNEMTPFNRPSERPCFNPFCSNVMSYRDFLNTNRHELITIKELLALWNNPTFKLFCCKCHQLDVPKKLLKFLDSLKNDKSGDSYLYQVLIDFRGRLTRSERIELIESINTFLYDHFKLKSPLDFNINKIEIKGIDSIFMENYELD